MREPAVQFRELLEIAPDAMIICDEKGKILLANSQVETMFGYTKDEIPGKTIETLVPEEFRTVHVFHRLQYAQDPRTRPMGKGRQLLGLRKDGNTFPVEISLSPLKTESGTIIAAAVRDITVLKKSEQKFKALLDAAPDATVIVDNKGIIQMVNLQTEKLFGYNREELIGKQVEILIPESVRSKHAGHRADFAANPKTRSMGIGIELNAVRKNGSNFPVEISLSPIETEEGLLISAAVRDISHRKQLETELKKTNEEIEAFTYSVSHDLRAPLRGIIGFTTILEEDYGPQLDDEGKRIVATIVANTQKMGHLIDDLLGFSRLTKQEIIKTTIDTGQLVEEIAGSISAQYANQKIEWQISKLPVINGDINTLRQVWINLLSNAVKYSTGRPVSIIQISAAEGASSVIFSVKDNGVGFDEKYKHKLFKVFQRLHSQEEFEGTGVGLALVQKIVQRHGGEVWAEAVLNEGATFHFSIPVNSI